MSDRPNPTPQFDAPTQPGQVDQGGKQSSQGQTLQRAAQEGRDPSSRSWGQPGYQPPKEAQSFTYDGKPDSIPDWADRGWAGYDAGPVLNVPNSDPNPNHQDAYSSVICRVGDTVVYTPGPRGAVGGFKVVRAEESGGQPGGEPSDFRPPAQTEASLEDLVRTGQIKVEDMDPEARAQYEARQRGGQPLTAEEAGHIPSEPQQ